MKTANLTKMAILSLGVIALTTSCKNETAGQSTDEATTTVTDSTATDTASVGTTTTTRVNDLQGSEAGN